MNQTFPEFFDAIDPIVTYDPLAEVLGAAEKGRLVYRYVDMVKLAGHSCPTVAGAWLMTRIGLQKLYGDDVPVRGEIRVEIREALDEGVAGVVGSCIGLVTGAAGAGGFKGLGGRMARNNRLIFGVELGAQVRMTRLDNALHVTLNYNPSVVPGDPQMQPLMQKILQGAADAEEKARFAALWQARVEAILCHPAPLEGLITCA